MLTNGVFGISRGVGAGLVLALGDRKGSPHISGYITANPKGPTNVTFYLGGFQC